MLSHQISAVVWILLLWTLWYMWRVSDSDAWGEDVSSENPHKESTMRTWLSACFTGPFGVWTGVVVLWSVASVLFIGGIMLVAIFTSI